MTARATRGFHGYRPVPDGRVGVRNHVLVVPTVICSAVVAERIAASIAPIGTALPHLAGCGQLGPDMHMTHETLAAYCRHPTSARSWSSRSAASRWWRSTSRTRRAQRGQAGADRRRFRARAERVRATARGIEIARELARRSRPRRARVVRGIDRSILSVKCGGSDYTSGLASNPGARPRRRSPGRSRRRRRARRDRRDHGRRASARGARLDARTSPRSCCASSTASRPKRWRSASTFAARSRRPAISAAA